MDAEQTRLLHERMPFAAVLGIEVLEATPERVRVRADWREERCTGGGVLHGGYLMAVADSIGGWFAARHLPPGAGTTTIESKTNFVRGAREGSIVATAEPMHIGRSTIVVTTRIEDDAGNLVAQTTQTQMVLRPPAA